MEARKTMVAGAGRLDDDLLDRSVAEQLDWLARS
jgi:hypothetical protein